ncbi:hypothetical protein [Saccharothrix coeruleofusca]|uniref:Uncharacterized protein n=1 Tax=Saccharothrix coeruleofusca TaxID=33919 RepID=A0A918AQ37_9PSEU|nr:hypothetical protein [Saccharothrix coeruleofusca]GGP69659.1 hypothetical protein GCM10010185_48160 [Saccharothrix coeruleofusca]
MGDTLAPIDEQLALHAHEDIQSPAPSLGSVCGQLYPYNGHQRTAALRDRRTGKVVALHFPAALAATVRQALGKEVETWGRLTRNVHDQVESISVEGLAVFETSAPGIALDDVIGVLGPDWTEGVDSAEWIGRQRG